MMRAMRGLVQRVSEASVSVDGEVSGGSDRACALSSGSVCRTTRRQPTVWRPRSGRCGFFLMRPAT